MKKKIAFFILTGILLIFTCCKSPENPIVNFNSLPAGTQRAINLALSKSEIYNQASSGSGSVGGSEINGKIVVDYTYAPNFPFDGHIYYATQTGIYIDLGYMGYKGCGCGSPTAGWNEVVANTLGIESKEGSDLSDTAVLKGIIKNIELSADPQGYYDTLSVETKQSLGSFMKSDVENFGTKLDSMAEEQSNEFSNEISALEVPRSLIDALAAVHITFSKNWLLENNKSTNSESAELTFPTYWLVKPPQISEDDIVVEVTIRGLIRVPNADGTTNSGIDTASIQVGERETTFIFPFHYGSHAGQTNPDVTIATSTVISTTVNSNN